MNRKLNRNFLYVLPWYPYWLNKKQLWLFVGFIEMNLGYWNSCNPMNRMAHLNWKGTIRMKYSPWLKETIISIFHNRNSRKSIHVIFTKSWFWFSKMLQMLHLVRFSVVKDDFFADWWIFYASYGHMWYSTRLFLVLEISFLTKFCFCWNNAFYLLATGFKLILFRSTVVLFIEL